VTDPAEVLVFVYGTLKRGGSNHGFLRGQRFLGEAITGPGYRLFSLGEYPGMVYWEGDLGHVNGEVWAVDEECLAYLDVLEGVAEGLYRRERVTLLPPFQAEMVVTFLYALSVDGRPDLGSDWVE
jgi:gamma-glutamylaminecyclotransferase